MLLLLVISFGEMRSYACYPSSELVGEGISVLIRLHSRPLLTGLHWRLCMHIGLCDRRMVRLLRLGFIPAVGAANPPFVGGDVSRSTCMAAARALALVFLWGSFGLRGYVTITCLPSCYGPCWWTYFPAAAKFSSTVPSFLGSLIEDDHHQAVDPPCGYEHLVF